MPDSRRMAVSTVCPIWESSSESASQTAASSSMTSTLPMENPFPSRVKSVKPFRVQTASFCFLLTTYYYKKKKGVSTIAPPYNRHLKRWKTCILKSMRELPINPLNGPLPTPIPFEIHD
jgi:hypothetical protein